MLAAAALLALAGVSAVSAQSQLTINTPSNPIFCQPTLLSWSGGTAPYYLTINEGGSTTNSLESLLSNTDETSYTWITDLPVGTSISVAIKDSTGSTNYAQQVTIAANPSGETTCGSASSQAVAQSSQVAAASSTDAASGASSAAGGAQSLTSSARAGASAAASAAKSGASAAVSGASSAAAAATSPASGAFSNYGVPALSVGLAAGAVAAALF